MFDSILSIPGSVTGAEFLICLGISIVYGVIIALVHMFRNSYSRNMVLALVVLPAIIQAIIMLVNGNIGTGVAVMGAFTLIRFRSQPGNAREISSIIVSMGVGLAMAMGYVGIAGILVALIAIVTIVLSLTSFGDSSNGMQILKITIPENLDYEGVFDDIFNAYTTKCELVTVKTTNMGSLFELKYYIRFKKDVSRKAFLDAIRCRNGNLSIVCGRAELRQEDL